MWSIVNYDIPAWACAAAFTLTGFLMVSCIKTKKYGPWQKALWAVWLVFFAVLIFF
jgi:phosphatidylserine synthase